MAKLCFKCNLEQPLENFYKHSRMADGHLNKCKSCAKKDVRENFRANHDYYQRYEQKRAMLPHRVEARATYQKLNPDIIASHKRKWNVANPEKKSAHTAVHNALRDRKLFKQPCEICGSLKVHGHHDAYSKPLDVRWLCPKHHKEHHKNMALVV